MKKIKYRAEKDMTVLDLLKQNGLSQKIIKHAKNSGNIQKDGKNIFVNKEIKKGDIITIILEDTESDIEPVEMPINIVYKDDDMMVINKQYGLSVMSTINLKEICLINGLQYYLLNNNIQSKIHVVNRLDRNTTGLMSVALNRFGASSLSFQLDSTLKRKYYAIVRGKLEEKEGRIINKIAKESMMTVRRCVRNDGKDATTNYKVVKEFSGYSLLDIELETGRTHQIRVTFASIGHPLIGDELYDPEYDGCDKIMLHSHYIEFLKPSTKEPHSIEIGLSTLQEEFIKSHELSQ